MIKFIGLGRGIKKAENLINLEAAERRIMNQTQKKFEEYGKVQIRAEAEARKRWLD